MAALTADDVLHVLNGLRPVDMTGWVFCVITGDESGREATSGRSGCWPFELGEIVVLGPSGREPFGDRRKPAKWFITTEEYDMLADALACRARVLQQVTELT